MAKTKAEDPTQTDSGADDTAPADPTTEAGATGGLAATSEAEATSAPAHLDPDAPADPNAPMYTEAEFQAAVTKAWSGGWDEGWDDAEAAAKAVEDDAASVLAVAEVVNAVTEGETDAPAEVLDPTATLPVVVVAEAAPPIAEADNAVTSDPD